MLLFIAWLFALLASEFLLLQINSVNVIFPLVYLFIGIVYLYQKNKLRNMVWLDENLRVIRFLNLKIVFVAAMSIILSIVVYINFVVSSFVFIQWMRS